MIKEIGTFNREVIGLDISSPQRLDADKRAWLIAALKEEIQEFEESTSLVDDADALIDLCYFAIGGLYRSGLEVSQIRRIFNVIHEANMSKKPGIKKGREGFDGVTDATKPDDWVAPEKKIETIIYG